MDDELLAVVLAPLPELAPDPSTTDSGRVAIARELDKLDSMTAGPVEWARVTTHARELLAKHCKDLEVACTLARALWELDGLDGLRRAANLVARFLAEFADCLPATPPARARLLLALDAWIDEKFANPAALADETDARRLAAADALGRLVAVAAPLLACLPDAGRKPDPGRKLNACKNLADRLRDGIRPAQVMLDEPPASSPPVALAPPELDDPHAYLRAIRDGLLAAADRLRADATPLALRIHRAALWQQLEQILVDDRGAVHWGVPSSADRTAVEPLARTSEPALALAALESLAAAHPLWLDLQRLAVATLTRDDCTAEIVDAVLHLVRRFPQLPDLTYADGTPLADTTTKSWLASLRAPAGPADVRPQVLAPRSLAELEARAGRASSERRRHLLRREQARGCVRDGRRDVAVHLYAALLAELRQPALAAWDPALLRTCLSEFVACARTVDEPLRRRVGADEAEDLLCALAPSLALPGP